MDILESLGNAAKCRYRCTFSVNAAHLDTGLLAVVKLYRSLVRWHDRSSSFDPMWRVLSMLIRVRVALCAPWLRLFPRRMISCQHGS